MGEPLAAERHLGTQQRWVIQLRGKISVSKGFVCLQTEQSSLAGTQPLQTGHVKPGGENGEEGASQKTCVAFDANLFGETGGRGHTWGYSSPSRCQWYGTWRQRPVFVALLLQAIYYLIAPSHRFVGSGTDPSLSKGAGAEIR